MSHSDAERRTLDAARAAADSAEATVTRLTAERVASAAAVADATRTLDAADPALAALVAELDRVDGLLLTARTERRRAGVEVTAALTAWLGAAVDDDVRTLGADLPVVLLPVRIETRFDPVDAPTVLRVRVYPDAICADTHEPWLTTVERDAAQAFWRTAWDPAREGEAWRRLLGVVPAPRAAWLVREQEPVNLAGRPHGDPSFPSLPGVRPAGWTRAARARLLPDRWVVRAYRGGPAGGLVEVASAVSGPVVDPLGLTLDPAPGVAGRILSDDLLVDDDAFWAFDFDAALAAGMAVELPLPATAPTAGFRRVVVLGVKASVSGPAAADGLGAVLDAHHYTRGLAFVPQGTPTNAVAGVPPGFPPADPGGAASLAVERGAPLDLATPGERAADGAVWVRALGLTDAHLDLHLGGIDRSDGRAGEQAAARAMSEALWPATLGYYLEQAMAPVFGPDAVERARRYVVEHVRGRGPYPAFRVGSTPYGLLPVTSLDRWEPRADPPSLLTLTTAVRRVRASGAPAACVPRAGAVDLAVRDTRLGLRFRGPAGWETLDVAATSEPALASSRPGLVDLVVRGPDDLLRHHRRDAAWSDGAAGSGECAGDPAVGSRGDGTLDVVALDAAGGLLLRVRDRGGWTDWHELRGGPLVDVACASGPGGRVDVVARTPQGVLVHRSGQSDGSGWTDPEPVGSEAVGRPALASREGRLDVVVLGTDGRLHHRVHDGGVWTDGPPLDGEAAERPALVATAEGWELVAVDASDRLVRRSLRRGRPGQPWSRWAFVEPDEPRVQLRVGRALDADGTVTDGWTTPRDVPEVAGPDVLAAGVAVGDVTGSGRPDVVVLRLTDRGAELRLLVDVDADGVPTGAAAPAVPVPGPFPPDVLSGAVTLADVTGDGRLDVVVLLATATGAVYRVGSDLDAGGMPALWSPWSSVPRSAGAVAVGVAVTDVGGDGTPDLVVLQAVEGPAGRQATYRVGRALDGAGTVTGGWAAAVRVPGGFGGVVGAFGFAVHDLDASGRLDALVSWAYSDGGADGVRLLVGRTLGRDGAPDGWIGPHEVPGGTPDTLSLGLTTGSLGPRPVLGDRVAANLRGLRDVWRLGVGRVPRVGGSADADADLLGLLGMEASAREVRVRPVLGRELLLNAQRLLGLGFFGMTDPADWPTWLADQDKAVEVALRALGPPAVDAATGAVAWRPRLTGMVADEQAPRFAHSLVTVHTTEDLPTSPDQPLQPENYVDWLLEHGGRIPDLRIGLRGLVGERPPLLALLLRHALLREHARIGYDLLDARTGTVHDRSERELVGLPVTGPAGPVVAPTLWDTWAAPPLPGDPALQDQLAELWDRAAAGEGPYRPVRDALVALRDLPTAELERLLTETLDVASHRLDAWITSLAADRLGELRRARATGVHLGAYGWVEDLRPARPERHRVVGAGPLAQRVQAESGGYIQAPTAAHGATAAVLRNAYLTRRGADRERCTVDLSSARVRSARGLLDALRDGDSLGSALGARVERGLHERSQVAGAVALEPYLDALRDAFPLVAGKGPTSGAPADPPSAAAARSVLDGLALRTAWRAPGGVDLADVVPGIGATELAALRAALTAEIDALDVLLDATADLLTAEAVHQVVQGSTGAAAASLDALAQGVRPPDPAVASAPRSGVPLTHRVAVVLGQPAAGATAGWPVVPTPRAVAAPELDAWAAAVLGDPRRTRCRVRTVDAEGLVTVTDVTLGDLGLRAVDVLALARDTAGAGPASELERRVVDVVDPAPDDRVDLLAGPDPGWDRTLDRSLAETLELARSLDAVVTGGRPLRPEDVVPPERAAAVPDDVWLADEALARARAVGDELVMVEGVVAPVLAAAGAGLSEAGRAALRDALVRCSALGVVGAYPARRDAGGGDDLVDRATSVHRELLRRLAARRAIEEVLAGPSAPAGGAERARLAVELAHAVLGPDAVLPVAFRPPAGDELGHALAAGPGAVGPSPAERTAALRAWVQQAARVQPGMSRWRRLALSAEVLGAALPLSVAQLPYAPGERWVGLPLDGRPPPPRGRVSLVLHRAGAAPAPGTWIGLLLDEWTEILPSATELTDVVYHYDDPGAEPPQAVLLAVPPGAAPTWDLATLTAVLQETVDLAHVRAVDAELLDGLGQVLPAVLLAANHVGDAVHVDLRAARVGD